MWTFLKREEMFKNTIFLSLNTKKEHKNVKKKWTSDKYCKQQITVKWNTQHNMVIVNLYNEPIIT